MPKHQLTRCELDVMEIVWKRHRVTVQEVVDELDRPLAYTTVMTTLNTLDAKGAVRRCGKVVRAFLYEPIVLKEDVRRAMSDDLTGSLYGGSVKSLVLSLLGCDSMSNEDIDELKAAIQSLESNE
ncbi:MAG: BlaI/MecI/CopY family transcriptional regulator [Planctomycetota bacterium]|nr:BlaI/MecI/CopY family transcriptional regulator [Planctomycetota bacterium]